MIQCCACCGVAKGKACRPRSTEQLRKTEYSVGCGPSQGWHGIVWDSRRGPDEVSSTSAPPNNNIRCSQLGKRLGAAAPNYLSISFHCDPSSDFSPRVHCEDALSAGRRGIFGSKECGLIFV